MKVKVKVCSVILITNCMIYAYTRLRYQVSVYRTIGPLVLHRCQKVTNA